MGWDYINNKMDLEIPGAYYSGPNTQPEIIRIDAPLRGSFSLSVIFPLMMVCAESEKLAKINISSTHKEMSFILLIGLFYIAKDKKRIMRFLN